MPVEPATASHSPHCCARRRPSCDRRPHLSEGRGVRPIRCAMRERWSARCSTTAAGCASGRRPARTRRWRSTPGRASASLQANARAGHGLPFVIEYDGELAGQLNVSSITYGSLSSATIGYWVAEQFAGRNITPTAVALATDYCFYQLGLHRMEICIRPENAPSLRVVEKLGFRYEGLRRRYIHINGDWRDHFCFALVVEELTAGRAAALARRRGAARMPRRSRPTTARRRPIPLPGRAPRSLTGTTRFA